MIGEEDFSLIYDYECTACKHQFEVIKSVKEYDNPEHCEKCQGVGRRVLSAKVGIHGASDWDTAHYSPAFGKVVKNNLEARRLAKERGWVEVGNENVERIHSHYDKQKEEKQERGYQDIVDSLTNLGEIA